MSDIDKATKDQIRTEQLQFLSSIHDFLNTLDTQGTPESKYRLTLKCIESNLNKLNKGGKLYE